jgi:hypothetical protein
MRRHYSRPFEPAVLADGVPNPHHLSAAAYLAPARAAARRGARRNGVAGGQVSVAFPGDGFAPTRITVGVHGSADVRLAAGRRSDRIDVRARATAELVPTDSGPAMPGHAAGGGYKGPLAYRQGKPTPRLFSALLGEQEPGGS